MRRLFFQGLLQVPGCFFRGGFPQLDDLAACLAGNQSHHPGPVFIPVLRGVKTVGQCRNELFGHGQFFFVDIPASRDIQAGKLGNFLGMPEGDQHRVALLQPQDPIIFLVAHGPPGETLGSRGVQRGGQCEIGFPVAVRPQKIRPLKPAVVNGTVRKKADNFDLPRDFRLEAFQLLIR